MAVAAVAVIGTRHLARVGATEVVMEAVTETGIVRTIATEVTVTGVIGTGVIGTGAGVAVLELETSSSSKL